MSAAEQAVQWAIVAAEAAADKLATDIVAFDVSDVLAITDVFVVCSARNPRQVAAIVDEVQLKVKQAGAASVRREGERENSWVLLDFVDVVVHVQLEETRSIYDLQRLWRDCPTIDLPANDSPENEPSEDGHAD